MVYDMRIDKGCAVRLHGAPILQRYKEKYMDTDTLRTIIRTVPDFPEKGILFYDITSVLASPEAFSFCTEQGARWIATQNVNKIAAVDARGFLFAAPIAYKMSLPLVAIRKNRKLPGPTISKSFTLEYGKEKVEIQKHDISPSDRVMIVDDLIATGGTLKAASELLIEGGATVQGFFAVVGLAFLNYNQILTGYRIETLIDF